MKLFKNWRIPFWQTIAIHQRGLPLGRINQALLESERAGLAVSIKQLENWHTMGVDFQAIVHAAALLKKEGREVNWDRLFTIAMITKGSGKNVVDVVESALYPVEIKIPLAESDSDCIECQTANGDGVKILGKAIIATYLNHYLGDDRIETIEERVIEFIKSWIMKYDSKEEAQTSLGKLTHELNAAELEAETSFEIHAIRLELK